VASCFPGPAVWAGGGADQGAWKKELALLRASSFWVAGIGRITLRALLRAELIKFVGSGLHAFYLMWLALFWWWLVLDVGICHNFGRYFKSGSIIKIGWPVLTACLPLERLFNSFPLQLGQMGKCNRLTDLAVVLGGAFIWLVKGFSDRALLIWQRFWLAGTTSNQRRDFRTRCDSDRIPEIRGAKGAKQSTFAPQSVDNLEGDEASRLERDVKRTNKAAQNEAGTEFLKINCCFYGKISEIAENLYNLKKGLRYFDNLRRPYGDGRTCRHGG